jgi:hypothetical protein
MNVREHEYLSLGAVVVSLMMIVAGAVGCATTETDTMPLEIPTSLTSPLEAPANPVDTTVDSLADSRPEDAAGQSALIPLETEPSPAVIQAPVSEAPPFPGRDLQPASRAGESAALAVIRTTLRRASRDLQSVDYSRLSGASRLQYEQSRRFQRQAEAAIRDRNLAFAMTLAEKAATLAAELAGR